MQANDSLQDIQFAVGKQAILQDQFPIESVKRIASFSCTPFEDKLLCAVVVMDYPSMNLVEHKYLLKKAPMPYVPGYLAFREGPLMLELYYQLEYDPDVLMVEGHGVSHPARCGIATYLGVELAKPCLGVADSVLYGEIRDTEIYADDQLAGFIVQTKQFARPLHVTAGHLISPGMAAELVKNSIRLPHKMPEPIHVARRLATKAKKNMTEEGTLPEAD